MDELQQQLQIRLERASESLLTSIEGVDERCVTGTAVFGDWTVKDALGHIVSWGDELRSEIGEILIDPAPRYSYMISSEGDYEEWNRSQAAQKKSSSLREVLAELDRDCTDTVDLINRLAPEELKKRGVVPWRIEGLPPPQEVTPGTSMSVVALLEIHIQHIEEHAEDIGRWRSEIGRRHDGPGKT
jgi:hypothetical protein